MRALLTPDVAPKTGIVILKPGAELLPMFRTRVLIMTPPHSMEELPSGRLADGGQPLLDEKPLINFFTAERVIRAAGGRRGLEDWVATLDTCQWQAGGDYHHHHHTTLRTESGAVCLCYSHDNQFRDIAIPERLEETAKLNVAAWVIRTACHDMGLGEGHPLTLPELCWWASLKEVIDLIPDMAARRVLLLPVEKETAGPKKEAFIVPEPDAVGMLRNASVEVKRILALNVDPESPESFMLRPKRRRWENESYTRWVKAQNCACCGMPADDPHHIIGHGQGGMGTKAHDLFVIPLCRAHHDELHADMQAFEEKYGSQLALLFRFLDHAIAVGVIGTGKK